MVDGLINGWVGDLSDGSKRSTGRWSEMKQANIAKKSNEVLKNIRIYGQK
jgi:hypothetical protein